MPRPILTLLSELEATMAELRQALEPISKLTAAFAGGDGPFPMAPAAAPAKRRGRKPGPKAVAKAASEPAPPAAVTPVEAPAAPVKVARKRKANPNMALQGKYMVALRKLSKADQAEVKRIRAEQGVEAALRAAATAAA